MRQVARDAGVDARLVSHYFGDKTALFAATVDLPVNPQDIVDAVLAGPREQVGAELVRGFLALWDDPGRTPVVVALLRSATTSAAAGRALREFLFATVFARVAAELDGSEGASGVVGADGQEADPTRRPGGEGARERRARLAGAQMLGLAVLRYVVADPVTVAATPDELAADLGPVLQRYLVGDGEGLDRPGPPE